MHIEGFENGNSGSPHLAAVDASGNQMVTGTVKRSLRTKGAAIILAPASAELEAELPANCVAVDISVETVDDVYMGWVTGPDGNTASYKFEPGIYSLDNAALDELSLFFGTAGAFVAADVIRVQPWVEA